MASIFGIGSGSMGNIWDEEEKRSMQEMLEYKMEQARMMQAQNPYAIGGMVAKQTPYVRPKGTISIQQLQTNPILTAPVQTLKDLWRAKFSGWVDPSKLEEEHSFMYQAIMRAQPGAFEDWKCIDENTGHHVIAIRLKEDAVANPS
jgi:hypothetical protein